jgi:hypothetical protein
MPGKVTGWLSFVGLPERVMLSLDGDFHRDIRGTVIRLSNPKPTDRSPGYMKGFGLVQTGAAGDITAGRPPQDYVGYPYVEWYADNGRVVLELDPSQVEVVGEPLPWESERPVSRVDQQRNLHEFMASVAGSVAKPSGGEG